MANPSANSHAYIDPTHKPADDEHREHCPDSGRRGDETGERNGIVQQVLQHGRQQRAGGEDNCANEEHEYRTGYKIGVFEEPVVEE